MSTVSPRNPSKELPTMSDKVPAIFVRLLLLFGFISQFQSTCEDGFHKKLQFIHDYVEWRKISYLIIVDEDVKSAYHLKIFRAFLSDFAERNVYISIRSSTKDIGKIIRNKNYKICVVVFWKTHPRKDSSEQTAQLPQYDENISWLIIALSDPMMNLEVVKNLDFGIDVDMVIAINSSISANSISYVRDQVDTSNENVTFDVNINAELEDFGSTDCYMPFQENVIMSSNDFCNFESGSINVDTTCLSQVYKIRKSNNSSVVVCPLGIWSSHTGTKHLKLFMDIEKRRNFQNKYPLILGNKDLNKVLGQEDPSDDDEESNEMNEFTTYFTTFLNARKTVLHFPRIGKRDETGEWTDLLGAIVKDEIDISSKCMSKNLERFKDMSFTHDVLTTTKNIYIQPEESSEFRDIFLVPFDNRLIIAVLSTGLIFSLIMTLSNKISLIIKTDDAHGQNKGVLDAIVWCIGIFSQQGTVWKPTLYGGQIVVLISLAFTLLIYNSYSAFITSVLSVELTSIRNVDDLLQSDYEIGYTKNSQDEVYLRSMNISQLNHIYLRGYLENDVNNISEGLMRVTKGSYGFFASSHLARKQLLNISNYRCRFKIDEIPIRYTVDHMAFVTAKKSTYKKLINLSIIKMYETGVYKYIHNHIHPDLPKCDKKKMYQSARLVDLTTAFAILILGHVLGVIFLIAEYIWNRKKSILRYFRNKVSNSEIGRVQQAFVP